VPGLFLLVSYDSRCLSAFLEVMGLAANGHGHNLVFVAAALHITDLVETMMVV